MSRDRIFLIQPGFEDPKRPGRRYLCPFCNQIEGLLASNPGLSEKLDVIRVAFPRPRKPVIDLIGEDNQGLPVLVLGDALPAPGDAKQANGHFFIDNTHRILEILAERYGTPYPH